MGTLGGVNFNLQLGLFGSSGEICGRILDNVSGPHPIIPPCTGPAPTDGSGLAVMDGFYALLFDDYKGYGLTLISNSGATGSNGVLNAFSELPFDDPGNPGNFFQNPFFGCAPTAEVRYDPLIPTPSGTGFWGPSFVASTPMGLVGTTPFSNGGEVFTMDPGKATPIATGIGYVGAVTAWPPNVSAGAAISVLIRIDSPVDVLVTDPNGKKLGMESGMPVNDFGSDGSDTGAGSHPRFYAINNPVPGDYIVQSVGTGTGPYTVHVYSVDTSKPFGQHIFRSGNAAPGALSSQNFTFGAGVGITFTNHPPTANAGPDQTVNAAANGTATVNLDGSLSSDPDGDPLTFTWAGPFGSVSGAQPQVILTGSVNVLQLTVDDGKGGTASANVTITVNSQGDTTPPVLTLPPTITREATSPAGAAVSYSATALDNVDGSVTPSCIPPAGSIFPLGTTTVNCTATDSSGNASSGSFKVIVQDTTAPIVTPPAGITVPATEATGARGNAFPALAAFLAGGSAVDIADPAPARLSPQVNGTGVDINTLFPLGTTNVAFLFRDASGNIGAASSTVTVILGKPIIAGMVSGQSKAGAEGSMYVDIMVTNTGTGNARNVRFSSLTLKTLRGTGTVKIDTKQSPPLPIVIGSLNAGVSAKIRLYFIVPKTVSQFSISGRGNLTDVTGKVIEIGTTETVTP